jgi:protein-tyrosine phosphatase
MLRILRDQGVDTVISTSHFYADDQSVDTFLEKRNKAFEMLRMQLPKDFPKIVMGAEVLYYERISRLSDRKKLCIEGTKLLLLEMPASRWTEYTVRELVELSTLKRITVILAHVERYMRFQSADTMRRLYSCGILMQVNASFFLQMKTKRTALQMLKRAEVRFVGSDCHNVTARPPRFGEAIDVIRKKFGEQFVFQMQEYGYSLLH